jgi:YVTN family beta-propeller protein
MPGTIVLPAVICLSCLLLLYGCSGTALAAENSSVVVYATSPTLGTVSIIDIANGTFIDVLSGLNDSRYLAVSPDLRRVYVTQRDINQTVVIDAGTCKVVARIPVYGNPSGVAVSPDGGTVYVACTADDLVAIINATGNRMTGMVGTGNAPTGVCVNPRTGEVYVTNGDRTLSVINGTSLAATIPIPGNLNAGMAIKPDGSRLYLAGGAYNLFIVDTATYQVSTSNMTDNARSPPAVPYPMDVAISPDGNLLYVACNDQGIRVMETGTNNVVRIIPVDTVSIALRPDGKALYAANFGLGGVMTVSTATGTIDNYFNFTPGVFDVAVIATGQYATPESPVPAPVQEHVPPVTALNLSGQADLNGAFIGKVTCNLTATDNVNGSGVRSIEYYMAGALWTTYDGPFDIKKPGNYSLYYHAFDRAGNIEPVKVTAFTVVAPQNAVTPVPTPTPVPSNATATPAVTPTPTPSPSPGFETIVAVAGLLAAGCALLARRK